MGLERNLEVELDSEERQYWHKRGFNQCHSG